MATVAKCIVKAFAISDGIIKVGIINPLFHNVEKWPNIL